MVFHPCSSAKTCLPPLHCAQMILGQPPKQNHLCSLEILLRFDLEAPQNLNAPATSFCCIGLKIRNFFFAEESSNAVVFKWKWKSRLLRSKGRSTRISFFAA